MWITTSVQGLGQSTVLPSCFLWASNKLQVQGITAGMAEETEGIMLNSLQYLNPH